MKQNIYIGTKIKSHNGQNIKIAIDELNQSIKRVQPNFINGQNGSNSQVLSVNRGSQILGRDGPPGCSLTLSNSISKKSMKFNILLTTKYQLFTNIYYLQS